MAGEQSLKSMNESAEEFGLKMPEPLKPGVPLFMGAEDWELNACIGDFDQLSAWNNRAYGFRLGADALVNGLIEGREFHIDALLYPIVYNYRQYIENSLKALFILTGAYLDESREFGAHHDLVSLWRSLRPRLEQEWNSGEAVQDYNTIDELLKEFTKWDPRSDAFRYPVDKKGNRTLEGLTILNVRHLKEIVASMAIIFEGSFDGISVALDYKREMEAEFRAEMNEYYSEY